MVCLFILSSVIHVSDYALHLYNIQFTRLNCLYSPLCFCWVSIGSGHFCGHQVVVLSSELFDVCVCLSCSASVKLLICFCLSKKDMVHLKRVILFNKLVSSLFTVFRHFRGKMIY